MATAKAGATALVTLCVLIVAMVGFTIRLSPRTAQRPGVLHYQLHTNPEGTSLTGLKLFTTSSTDTPTTMKPPTTTMKPPKLPPTMKPAQKAKPPPNPGCIAKKIGKYKPVDMDIEYHHPSLIQYAKLSKTAAMTSVSLTFMEYVSLLSAHKFLKPDKILIHTYTNITGKYWDMVQKWDTPVVIKKNERVVKLSKKTVSYITHHADFIKVRGLYEYGGTISDFDVIIVNGTKWNKMQKKAECVLSKELERLNAGFNSCIVKSPFVKRWLDGYYTAYRGDWLYNAAVLPKNILEYKRGEKVCYNMYVVEGIASQPLWNGWGKWLKYNGVPDWREKAAAHYFNKVMKNYDESHVQANNSFGELLRYVMDS